MEFLKFLLEDNKKIDKAIFKELLNAALKCRKVEQDYIDDLKRQKARNILELKRMGVIR